MFDLAAADENIRFSHYCWRVKWALAHKNLDVKYLPWDFTEREKIYFSCKTLEEAIQVTQSPDFSDYFEEVIKTSDKKFTNFKDQRSKVFTVSSSTFI